jgi:endoglucanase
VDYFVGAGFNTFRLPFLMERLSSAGARQPFNPTYLSTLKQAVAYISGKGAYTILDPHNYMRFNGSLITSTADFQAWWTQFAREFAYEPRVIFAAMNKPNGLEINLVASLNQAALDGIRAAGATSQLVLLEGSDFSYARSWISSGNAVTMNRITDPSNNFAFSMHLYLDRDGSGKSPDCVSESIGAERLSATTEWLKLYKYRAIISEIGAGSNRTLLYSQSCQWKLTLFSVLQPCASPLSSTLCAICNKRRVLGLVLFGGQQVHFNESESPVNLIDLRLTAGTVTS